MTTCKHYISVVCDPPENIKAKAQPSGQFDKTIELCKYKQCYTCGYSHFVGVKDKHVKFWEWVCLRKFPA